MRRNTRNISLTVTLFNGSIGKVLKMTWMLIFMLKIKRRTRYSAYSVILKMV